MEIYKIIDSFRRNHPTMEVHSLELLLMADPTASQNGMGSFTGRYGVWIGNMYANGGIKTGDAPELKSALFTYDKNKTQLPQIKDCKSLSELIEWVKDLSDDFKSVRNSPRRRQTLRKCTRITSGPYMCHTATRRQDEEVKVRTGAPLLKMAVIIICTAIRDHCISTSASLMGRSFSFTSKPISSWMLTTHLHN